MPGWFVYPSLERNGGAVTVNADGSISFAPANGTANAFTGQVVMGDAGTDPGSDLDPLTIVKTTTATADQMTGAGIVMYGNSAASSALVIAGVDATAATYPAAAGDYTEHFYGVGGATVHLGTGTLDIGVGIAGTVWNGNAVAGFDGDGTITEAIAVHAQNGVQTAGGSGSITTYQGVKVDTVNVGDTNNYGILVNQPGISATLTENPIGNTTNSIAVAVPADTVTMGDQTATTTNAHGISVGVITYESTTNTRTLTNAASLFIAGAPVASTNVAIDAGSRGSVSTKGLAIWVDADDVRFDGLAGFYTPPVAGDLMNVGGGATFNGTSGLATGIGVDFASNGAVATIGQIGIIITPRSITTALPLAIGLDVASPQAAVTIDALYGVFIDSQTHANVTAGYGLYVEGAKTYAIWSDSGVNRFDGNLDFTGDDATAGVNIVLGTTNGTKIGTATGQKLGFWNATPVVQQVLATGGGATVDNVISLLQTLGLCKQS
ncbi:MAG: hypothetical protein IT318_20355 [Anaerolineales bacterium]|nr:hypothetical protein [Anaerolineales bacterium]